MILWRGCDRCDLWKVGCLPQHRVTSHEKKMITGSGSRVYRTAPVASWDQNAANKKGESGEDGLFGGCRGATRPLVQLPM